MKSQILATLCVGRLIGNMKLVHGYLSGSRENSHRHLGYAKGTMTSSLESKRIAKRWGKVFQLQGEQNGGCTNRNNLEGSLGVLICVIGML